MLNRIILLRQTLFLWIFIRRLDLEMNMNCILMMVWHLNADTLALMLDLQLSCT